MSDFSAVTVHDHKRSHMKQNYAKTLWGACSLNLALKWEEDCINSYNERVVETHKP